MTLRTLRKRETFYRTGVTPTLLEKVNTRKDFDVKVEEKYKMSLLAKYILPYITVGSGKIFSPSKPHIFEDDMNLVKNDKIVLESRRKGKKMARKKRAKINDMVLRCEKIDDNRANNLSSVQIVQSALKGTFWDDGKECMMGGFIFEKDSKKEDEISVEVFWEGSMEVEAGKYTVYTIPTFNTGISVFPGWKGWKLIIKEEPQMISLSMVSEKKKKKVAEAIKRMDERKIEIMYVKGEYTFNVDGYGENKSAGLRVTFEGFGYGKVDRLRVTNGSVGYVFSAQREKADERTRTITYSSRRIITVLDGVTRMLSAQKKMYESYFSII